MKGRLERQEKQTENAVQLRVQAEQLQREVDEWRAVAADHVVTTAPSPRSLRTRIEEILNAQLVSADDRQVNQSSRRSLDNEAYDLKTQNGIHVKAIADLRTALKHHQTLLHRVQKKLMLVAKERDCYRQVMEHYEKEVTVSGPTGGGGQDGSAQLRMRVDMLEKAVTGYKDICANLERDLQQTSGDPATSDGATVQNKCERLQKESDELRVENERLRRRKEELELRLEQISMRSVSEESEKQARRPFKVVHFQQNPADLAYESHRNELEKLQAEIERLKRKIRQMESDQAEMSNRLNETEGGAGGLTCNMKELNQLRAQLQSLDAKNQHLKEVYKAASLEFREVVYLLFG